MQATEKQKLGLHLFVSCLFLLYSVFFSGSNPWDVFVAFSDQRETPQRDAEEGGVLWRPAQGFGENVPKTEIYQQTRQKEIGIQTRPQRLSGKKTKHICILVTSTGVPYLRTNILRHVFTTQAVIDSHSF